MNKETRRTQLYGLLGRLPDRDRPISVRLVGEEQHKNYVLEKLVLDLNGLEDVPAYFTRPLKPKDQFPVILYNHAHGGNYVLGKDELLIGRKALQDIRREAADLALLVAEKVLVRSLSDDDNRRLAKAALQAVSSDQ